MRLLWLGLAIAALVEAAPAPVDFVRDIQPIFARRCAGCHGAQQQMNGLRLDDSASALKAIVPGDSAASKLIVRVTSTKKGFAMPPVGAPLSEAEIANLRAWIDAGAKWPAVAAKAPAPTHWSFLPVHRPTIPDVRARAWVRNPIDAFVLARLESESIQPSAEADRRTLLRRLSLDLTGLPPTPDEMAAFLADNRPDAYERQVDRLLASPHYGERWARNWLDLAHYADSDGYEKDRSRPWAWRYRQWVIDALNRDVPFDEFTIEQLAGDLLPDATVEQRVATGFLRNTLTNREAGVDRRETRFEQIVNRTNTVSTTWLGLTVGCAQCHNHCRVHEREPNG
jgi:mono/diheme cytochrome c family protein